MSRLRIRLFASLALAVGAIPAASEPATAPASRDVTFIAASDSHYAAFEHEDRNDRVRESIRQMNAIASVSWPKDLGGDPVSLPRGVVMPGDLINDGDRLWEGKNQGARQWAAFVADFGLDGTDGLLKYPVYEGWGNHDGPPAGRERHGFSLQAELKKRNAQRKEKGRLSNLSENGLHYSWDWDDVHFVQLNLYPADRQHPGVKYNATWHDPQGALTFLKQDAAKHVGESGRPVVLLSHCGFDTDWWHPDDWKAAYDAMKPYNVVLYLYGHTGTGVRDWAPEGETRRWTCINDGHADVGFFVIQIRENRLRFAYRARVNVGWGWKWAKAIELPAEGPSGR
jgi:cytolysin (calcineurin-like family phosphatase)